MFCLEPFRYEDLWVILLVHVVVELVVASQSDQCSQTKAIREEDLRYGVDPHLKTIKSS